MIYNDTYDTLLEHKLKNRFYKKEVFLIAIMIISIMLLIFTLNKWNNPTSSVFIIISLILVHAKLFSLFKYRENKYNSLLKKHITGFKSSIYVDIENKQTNIERDFKKPKKTQFGFKPDYTKTEEKLKVKVGEKSRKLKEFNYEFEKNKLSFKTDNYLQYFIYLENSFSNNKIKPSEYRTVLKILMNYLETENSDIIKNTDSNFKEKIETIISELQDSNN